MLYWTEPLTSYLEFQYGLIGHHLAQTGILLLKSSQLLNHLRAHSAILLTPAIVGVLRDFDLLTDFRDGFALSDQDIGLPELGHDLSACVFPLHNKGLSKTGAATSKRPMLVPAGSDSSRTSYLSNRQHNYNMFEKPPIRHGRIFRGKTTKLLITIFGHTPYLPQGDTLFLGQPIPLGK